MILRHLPRKRVSLKQWFAEKCSAAFFVLRLVSGRGFRSCRLELVEERPFRAA